MSRTIAALGYLIRDDQGQDLLEYGIVITLIAIACMLVVTQVGDVIDRIWWGPIADVF